MGDAEKSGYTPGAKSSNFGFRISDFLQLLGNLFEVVALDDVAGFVLVEVAELDAALEAVADFLHVVLEAAERREAAIVNGLAAAQDAGARGAGDAAIGDEAAGDLATWRDRTRS